MRLPKWLKRRRKRRLEQRSTIKYKDLVRMHEYIAKRDDEITQQDYIDLVKRVQKGFLKGVQTNIRMRIAAEWTTWTLHQKQAS